MLIGALILLYVSGLLLMNFTAFRYAPGIATCVQDAQVDERNDQIVERNTSVESAPSEIISKGLFDVRNRHENVMIQKGPSNNTILSVNRKTIMNKTKENIRNDKQKNVITTLNSTKEKSNRPQSSVRPEYIQICNADSPLVGDFWCSRTVIEGCCAFFIRNTNEGKDICNNHGNRCQGFVVSTIMKQNGRMDMVMYLKNTVSAMINNKVTNFFVKSSFMKEVGWRSTGID